jgi:hypothetical protein
VSTEDAERRGEERQKCPDWVGHKEAREDTRRAIHATAAEEPEGFDAQNSEVVECAEAGLPLHPLPNAACRLPQQSLVAEHLKLLADFVPDVAVTGVESGQLGLEGVEVVVA